MFALAVGKARTGEALGNPVLLTEGRVTLVDALLATAVLLGVSLDAALGWWWADPLAGYGVSPAGWCREAEYLTGPGVSFRNVKGHRGRLCETDQGTHRRGLPR